MFDRHNPDRCMKIYNILIVYTVIITAVATILNLFNLPFRDEAWRTIQIWEGKAAINTTAPLYARFMRNWNMGSGLFCMRAVTLAGTVLTWIFLGYAAFAFLKRFQDQVKTSVLTSIVGTVCAASLFHTAYSTDIWNHVADYETLAVIFCNISAGCFVLLQIQNMKQIWKDVSAVFLGIAGMQLLFISAPTFSIPCFMMFGFLLLKQYRILVISLFGFLLGTAGYFLLVQNPADFFLFIRNAVAVTLHSGDSHSLSHGIIPWIKMTVLLLVKKSFLPVLPLFFILYLHKSWKNPVFILLFCFCSAIILFRCFFGDFHEFVPLSIVIFYGVTLIAILLAISWKYDGSISMQKNEIYLYLLFFMIPFCARIGSNLPLNICGRFYLPYLFLPVLMIFFRTSFRPLLFILLFFLFYSSIFTTVHLIRNPPLLLRHGRVELEQFGFNHIYASEGQFRYYSEMKNAIGDCPYLVCHWEDWEHLLILRKKPLNYSNFHYTQQTDLVSLIQVQKIRYEDIAFLIKKPFFDYRNWLSEEKLRSVLKGLDATEADRIQVGETYVVKIRKK